MQQPTAYVKLEKVVDQDQILMDNAVPVEQLEQFPAVNPFTAIRSLHALRTPSDVLQSLGEKSHAGHIKRIQRIATV